jgi:PrtD family type I secretion system ABC transporter
MRKMNTAPTHLLRHALSACRLSLACVFAFSFGINTLLLTVSLYMMQVYDRVLGSRHLGTLLYLTIIAVLALLVLGLLEIVRSRILINTSTWLERTLARAVVVQSLGEALRGRGGSTDILRDLREVRAFLGGPGILLLFDAPWMPLFLGAIYLLHPVLGVVATGAAVLLFGLGVLNDLLARRPLNAATDAGRRGARRIEAGHRNAEIVDALGMTGMLVDRWERDNDEALRLQALASRRAGGLFALSKSLRLVVQVLLLGAGAWLVVDQELTGGAMIAASIILARALAPVEQAIGAWKQVVGARNAYRRLADTLARPAVRPTTMALPAPHGDVRVDNLRYAPPGSNRLLLRDISFALPAGESVAILGPSGAGKSTLARLLVGSAAPSSGQVRLDGAELFPRDRTEIGPYVGYLPQSVELFGGTVAENIARLSPAPDAAAVVEAAAVADCHEMILRLPDGYDTEIGEAGAHLSAGQRQRIALARAVYGNPRVVVLDEPNANLDAEGEQALANALVALKRQGATVIVVSHRLNLLHHCDRILMLRAGALEAFGPRAEVLGRLQQRPFAVSRAPQPPATSSTATISAASGSRKVLSQGATHD